MMTSDDELRRDAVNEAWEAGYKRGYAAAIADISMETGLDIKGVKKFAEYGKRAREEKEGKGK